ncbi:MAG: hypothetical protein F6K65_12185 [Moorea sp. SIO3C2]|nr:hypothetical protein [Moorena sp. SIO3C2]
MISLPEQGFFPTVTSLPKNINLESIRQKKRQKAIGMLAIGKFISRTRYSRLATPDSLLPTPAQPKTKVPHRIDNCYSSISI